MNAIYKELKHGRYMPNNGQYLQKLTGSELINQKVFISESESFDAVFRDIFKYYENGPMQTSSKRFKDWDAGSMRLWQNQLNFITFCSTSACGISVQHLKNRQ